MSTSSIKTVVANKLLAMCQSEERKVVLDQISGVPQVVFVNNLKWIDDVILEMMDRTNADGSAQMTKKRFKRYNNTKDIKKAKVIAVTYQDRWLKTQKLLDGSKPTNVTQTNTAIHVQNFDPTTYNMLVSGDAVVVGSFSTAGELKKAIIDAVIRKGHKSSIDNIKAKTDKGHGAKLAVSALSIARGAQTISELLSEKQQKEFEKFITAEADGLLKSKAISGSEASLIKELVIDYKNLVDDKGNIVAQYVPYLMYQDKYSNRAKDAVREKFLKKVMFKYFQKEVGAAKLMTLKGSDSLETQIKKRLVKSFVKSASRKKNLKTTLDSNLQGAPKKGKGKVKVLAATGIASATNNKKARGPQLTEKKQGPSHTPLRLIASFNQKLPQKIKENMKAPALVNRTGRFAESVSVKDVQMTPQGFPSFGFTYQPQPYQVFEQGRGAEPWADGGNRDPRKLIDKTMREIAAEAAMGRFFTRRL